MIFVDTVAWLYLFDQQQTSAEGRKAKTFVKSLTEAMCTSDLVIAETHKWLVHHGRPAVKASATLRMLVQQELAVILPIEPEDRNMAMTLVEKYIDQKLSYEDAMTVALTSRFGIKQVFSFDKHFLLFPNLQRVPE